MILNFLVRAQLLHSTTLSTVPNKMHNWSPALEGCITMLRRKRCPLCKSLRVRQSRRSGILERLLLPLFRLRPYRCENCDARFLHPSLWRSSPARAYRLLQHGSRVLPDALSAFANANSLSSVAPARPHHKPRCTTPSGRRDRCRRSTRCRVKGYTRQGGTKLL